MYSQDSWYYSSQLESTCGNNSKTKLDADCKLTVRDQQRRKNLEKVIFFKFICNCSNFICDSVYDEFSIEQ